MSLKSITNVLANAIGAVAGSAVPPGRPEFQTDKARQYLMPAHFGLMPEGRGSLDYLDVTTLAVSYLTDADRLRRYLPWPLEVGREPRITVFYAMNREVEWLAGGQYNLLGVNAEVHFGGKVDRLDGAYCLALWENDAIPITFGRELLGIPKIYADIEDPQILRGKWNVGASLHGHRIADMTIDELRPLPAEQVAAAAEASTKMNWLGWKYIPQTGAGGAITSHATLVPTSARPREAWTGVGEVVWHKLTWEQNPTQSHIVNALAELPILEYGPASVSRGLMSLQAPGKSVRALS